MPRGFATGFGLRVAASYVHGIVDPKLEKVFHALSAAENEISPGQLSTILGESMGPIEGVSGSPGTNGQLPIELSTVSVVVNELPAQIVFESENQIGFVVPTTLEPCAQTSIIVKYGWQSSSPIFATIVEVSPGLLADDSKGGSLVALNQNGSLNSPAAPAPRGSVITCFGSGFGQMYPRMTDGLIVSETLRDLPRPVRLVRVLIGGIEASLAYCGQAPGMVFGVVQLNIIIPEVPSGSASVVVSVGDRTSRQAISVQIG